MLLLQLQELFAWWRSVELRNSPTIRSGLSHLCHSHESCSYVSTHAPTVSSNFGWMQRMAEVDVRGRAWDWELGNDAFASRMLWLANQNHRTVYTINSNSFLLFLRKSYACLPPRYYNVLGLSKKKCMTHQTLAFSMQRRKRLSPVGSVPVKSYPYQYAKSSYWGCKVKSQDPHLAFVYTVRTGK